MLRLIIIGLTVGDGMVLLLGETCVCLGVGEEYGVNVKVNEEMESMKYQGS